MLQLLLWKNYLLIIFELNLRKKKFSKNLHLKSVFFLNEFSTLYYRGYDQ